MALQMYIIFIDELRCDLCVGFFFPSLLDVLMQDSRLYLIFEFLSMDLKKYLDSIPSGQYLDDMLVKVCIGLNYNLC